MISKLPIRKAEHYNLFLVPEDHRKTYRFRISMGRIRLLLLVAFFSVAFSFGSFIAFLHYRSLYKGVEAEHQANLEFARERGEILSKLTRLETVVDSAEGYANKISGLIGTERPNLRKGVGSLQAVAQSLDTGAHSITWQDLVADVEEVENRARSVDLRIQELVAIQEDKLLFLASKPSIWPVKGWVTSEFGYRRSPFTNRHDFHTGIDIAAQWGTTVVSPATGVVRYAGYKGGLGRAVVVDHGYGIRSYYGHAAALLVKPGDVVKRGTKLAKVGSSGHSTGPHLHYEIHVDGVPVDPMQYVLQ